jgi:hypothetical protein
VAGRLRRAAPAALRGREHRLRHVGAWSCPTRWATCWPFFAGAGGDDHLAYARPTLGARDMLKGEFFTLTLFVLLGIR